MRLSRYIFALVIASCMSLSAMAQVDKHEVRQGNRDFRKENYKAADVDYRKAILRDSTSFAANYNLANTLYKIAGGQQAQGGMEEVEKYYKAVEEQASVSAYGADYWFNVGDAALASKNYQQAVDAFKKSLLMRPEDMDAKENYIYAKKMLEDQQQNGGGGGNDQNQDQNDQNQDQNDDQNDQNQDQNKDQNGDGDQDKNDDQNKGDNDGQNDQNDQNNQDRPQQQQPQQQGISPQQAQQMLQAIQAKEKETQDKVNKEKAAVLRSRQKEKNW
ncbi:MAG: tetratricopeptide repeat protein [Bacteroidales bacterium]|nr:tetratricopeptide repeat protein [Candidatus Cryptobacteroides caccocaballi]